jgi:hypothetical protein
MALIEQRVYDLLKNDSSVAGLVGTRIYPVVIPEQTTYPCISFQTISDRGITTLNNDLPTLNFKRIQINIWSETYGNCKILEERIKTIVYTQNSNADTINGKVETIRDTNDKELKIFSTSLDILMNNK